MTQTPAMASTLIHKELCLCICVYLHTISVDFTQPHIYVVCFFNQISVTNNIHPLLQLKNSEIYMHTESFPPNKKKNQGIEKFISPCSVDVHSLFLKHT